MRPFLMAIGMFTKIPAAHVQWKENNGPAALCYLPFIGLICGAASALVYWICAPLHPMGRAALTLLSLYFVCGFLHVDGFMDVCDALMSSRPNAEKIMILKDSRVGAFSVISAVLLIVMLFCGMCISAENNTDWLIFLLTPVLSRAFCVCAAFAFKPMSDNGLLVYFRKGAAWYHMLIALAFLCAGLVAAFVLIGATYFIIAISVAGALALFTAYAAKTFGGINGDVLGFIIVVFEAGVYFAFSVLQ